MGKRKMPLLLILAVLVLTLPAAAQAKSVFLGKSATDTSLFGHLDQENPIIQAVWGHEGCPPTAMVNALVYLQKNYPGVYGTYLVPDYSPTAMAQTAVTLGGPSYLNVTKEGYTDDKWHCRPRDLIWGSYFYMQALNHDMVPRTFWFGTEGPVWLSPWDWTLDRPVPSWAVINNFAPNPMQIYNSLSASKAVIVEWYGVNLAADGSIANYYNGNTHYLTVTGITWDDQSKTGILYYIDPEGGLARSSPLWLVDNWALCMDYKNPSGWYTGPAMLVFQMAFGPASVPPVQPASQFNDTDIFDRGLPIYDTSLPSPSNINGTSNSNRSNFSYSQTYTATQPTTYNIAGDDVVVGSAGQTYSINTIRVWMLYGTPANQYDRTFISAPNVPLKLWVGPAGGSLQSLSATSTLSRVWYSDGENYQRLDGAWRRLWQIDFPVNLKIRGGQKYRVFLDGLFINATGSWQSPSLCTDKALLSNNPRQDGADDQYLVLTLVDGVPSGAPAVTSGQDANIQMLGDLAPPGVLPPLNLLLSD
jgi:hypothetical protein